MNGLSAVAALQNSDAVYLKAADTKKAHLKKMFCIKIGFFVLPTFRNFCRRVECFKYAERSKWCPGDYVSHCHCQCELKDKLNSTKECISIFVLNVLTEADAASSFYVSLCQCLWDDVQFHICTYLCQLPIDSFFVNFEEFERPPLFLLPLS